MRKLVLFVLMFAWATIAGAAQHDYVVDNGPGAAVRADINSVLQAVATNNSGATEPATLYANMWWYDTATSLLKRRNNANDAWITLGLEAADTDGTMASNSDSKVPTQKAAKTYVDARAALPSTADYALVSNGLGAAPAYEQLNLATAVQGALPIANGGTGQATAANAINALLPTQTDNSGKFLTTNGSAASWGTADSTNISNYSSGTDVTIASALTERLNCDTSDYVKVKEVKVDRAGTVYAQWSQKGHDGNPANWMKARIYVDGVAFGTEYETYGTPYEAKTQADITVSKGSLVQLYYKFSHTAANNSGVKDFIVKRAYSEYAVVD